MVDLEGQHSQTSVFHQRLRQSLNLLGTADLKDNISVDVSTASSTQQSIKRKCLRTCYFCHSLMLHGFLPLPDAP